MASRTAGAPPGPDPDPNPVGAPPHLIRVTREPGSAPISDTRPPPSGEAETRPRRHSLDHEDRTGKLFVISIGQLPRAKLWRLMARALARALLTTTALVTLYYVLPLHAVADAPTALVLGGGLVAVALIIAYEVRVIIKAEFPAIQAVIALATVTPLFLLAFAVTYYVIGRTTPGSFTQPLSRTDSLYFTVTTFSTVGYGDITARTDATRIIVTVQMLSDLLVLGFGIKVFVGAVQIGRQRRTPPPDTSSESNQPADGGR
jgi:voltage-gated potassium channel